MEHKITVVGIGPGSPDYLLPIASRTINQATVLVGSKRALATLAPSGADTKVIDKDIQGVVEFIRTKLLHTDVVVMVSGDPGFYSMLTALRREFSPDIINVIPGISSMQLAFARIAQTWQDAVLVSMHGRKVTDDIFTYYVGKKLGFLTDLHHNPTHIARLLMEHGWPEKTQVWLCDSLSYEQEQIVTTTLQETNHEFEFKNCVMVVVA